MNRPPAVPAPSLARAPNKLRPKSAAAGTDIGVQYAGKHQSQVVLTAGTCEQTPEENTAKDLTPIAIVYVRMGTAGFCCGDEALVAAASPRLPSMKHQSK